MTSFSWADRHDHLKVVGIKNEKVKNVTSGICNLVVEEINCQKRIARFGSNKTFDSMETCSTDAMRESSKLLRKFSNNLSDEEFEEFLIIAHRLEEKFKVKKNSDVCVGSSKSFNDLLNCYHSVFDYRLVKNLRKLCPRRTFDASFVGRNIY